MVRPQTQVVSDTGNRPACTSSCGNGAGLGPNWTAGFNPMYYWALTDNPGFSTNFWGWPPDDPDTTYYPDVFYSYTAATFTPDQYSQLDCHQSYQGSKNTCGVVVRVSGPVGSQNGYACAWSNAYTNGHSELYIGKWTNGSYGSGDLIGYYTWNKAPGVIFCSIVGNVITMKNDGVVVLTTTDNTITTGSPGLDVLADPTTAALNWSGGNMTGGGPTTYSIAVSDGVTLTPFGSGTKGISRMVFNVKLN
jgi:hypothetical protein